MLYYERIAVCERIDINETCASKECVICHYWYFLEKGLKFQCYVCNRCHDVQMMSINLNNIAISNINSVDYHCIIELAKML